MSFLAWSIAPGLFYSRIRGSLGYNSHMTFKEKVYAVVARIPRGKTMSYKEVARRAGSPRAYRAVGNIMNRNPDMKRVPCHRVVPSSFAHTGNPGGYARGRAAKIAILKKEGAIV
jgi:methylated-DNA-[protein]-cysteine S-methyltransferase